MVAITYESVTVASRIVGVLGGMGPGATVDFMARVLEFTPGDRDEDHVHLIVDQNPTVPNRQDALAGHGEDPGPVLAEMARRLESAGADFLVIPCNTVHAFEQSIVAAVDIPLVSIIDETVSAVPADCTTVGLLATEGCITAGVYQKALAARGLQHVEPSADEMRGLMRAVFAIKSGDTGAAVATPIRELAAAMVARGAEVVIVACTEVPLVLGKRDVSVPLLSSTDILAQRTVQLALSE